MSMFRVVVDDTAYDDCQDELVQPQVLTVLGRDKYGTGVLIHLGSHGTHYRYHGYAASTQPRGSLSKLDGEVETGVTQKTRFSVL